MVKELSSIDGKKFVWFQELRGFGNDEEVDILLFLSQFFYTSSGRMDKILS
jgi:hypothetical protein